jgi:hypothetical protein
VQFKSLTDAIDTGTASGRFFFHVNRAGQANYPARRRKESNGGACQSSYKRPFMRTDQSKSQNGSIARLPRSHK